jgi:hypothetical protein
VCILSKVGGSKSVYLCTYLFIYLFRGKARKFGRMEETKRKYENERPTIFKSN